MKVRFNRQEMADALTAVNAVAASRTPKPILQCVKLEIKPDFMLLSATDMELGIRSAVNQVEVDEAGETLVMADTLTRIVRESSDDLLALEMKGNILHVRGSDSHFQIVSQDTAEFPHIPTIEGDPDFTIELGSVRRQIEWTRFAAARESTRYAINGVLWEAKGEVLTMVATDGRRLSCATGAIQTGKGELDITAILPIKAVALLEKFDGEADSPVAVKITGNQALFRGGSTMLSTSLVEGRYPNYQDVIPNDSKYDVEFPTLEFQSALRRAALLTNEESKGVRLAFGDGKLTISSRAPEQGEATVSLSAAFDGEPMEIGFNPVFLLDVLRVVHSDKMTFSFKEPSRPGVVRVDKNMTYVVMPVSLS